MARDVLFTAHSLGDIEVPNRILMAPLTRNRAQPDGTPANLAIEYYRQRAGAGLIFTEATQISQQGKGYIDTPGIHHAAHVDAWRQITDAVHAEGGRIVVQLWHVGRISDPEFQPGGGLPVAPSAIKPEGAMTFTSRGPAEPPEPRALALDEIPGIVQQYREAAVFARDAGFDGIEVHAANGYLIDQFLRDGSNRRDDAYGGSADNRARLLFDVIDAVLETWSAGRVGVRLSPFGAFNAMSDSDPEATFSTAIEGLNRRKLAFLHLVEAFPGEDDDPQVREAVGRLRALWKGAYVANGGYDAESAAAAIDAGHADAITFGRPFIANPDLPRRFLQNARLNEPDQDTFYGGDHRGYTDYPALAA